MAKSKISSDSGVLDWMRQLLLLLTAVLCLPVESLASGRVQVPNDREVRMVLPLLWIDSAEERRGEPNAQGQSQGVGSVLVRVRPDGGIELTSNRRAEFLDPAMPTGTKLALVRAGLSTEIYCEITANVTRPRRCFGDSTKSGVLDHICFAYGTGGSAAGIFRDTTRYGVLGAYGCVGINAANRPTYKFVDRTAFEPDEFVFSIGEGYGDWNYWINWSYKNPQNEIVRAGFFEFKFTETETEVTKSFGGLSLGITRPAQKNAVPILALRSVDREIPLGCFSPGLLRGGILQAATSPTLCRDELALARVKQEANAKPK
jgi:hypothetical protein